uniref:Uncharacterized protein n=1 Tax=Tanacetum cinerariifolium TaxID=118510 RepID=A0A6L2KJA2_TANCI|nr:hypothetical protein [Tanacetum cinerariifolium]
MSSDNVPSTVTYTSISSDSDGPSWGIPLMNAGELLELDPYEEPYADDASPIFESPGHIFDSEPMEEDSIDYPDEPENENEDPVEDHTNYPADGGDGDSEPSDDEDDEDEEPTEDEDDDEEEEEHLALADSSTVPVVNLVPSTEDTKAFETDEAQKNVRLEPPILASMKARIAEHAVAPIPLTNPAYDHEPLSHRTTMIRMRDDILKEDTPPRR